MGFPKVYKNLFFPHSSLVQLQNADTPAVRNTILVLINETLDLNQMESKREGRSDANGQGTRCFGVNKIASLIYILMYDTHTA